jgi:hypothetical protein
LSSAVVAAGGGRAVGGTPSVQADFCFVLFVVAHIKELQQKDENSKKKRQAVQENEIKNI